jgi:glutaredoxin-related protein
MRNLLSVALLTGTAFAFTAHKSPFTQKVRYERSVSLHSSTENTFIDRLVEDVKTKVRIAQESSASGADFKQIIADVLAGEYDADAVNAKLDELINSAPCVMFIWEASPFSKKAVEAMEVAGADVKIVRLDAPWDEGNSLRAGLGKRTGRTSVPSIWIAGEYVGGFDGGVSEESPGIVNLAFRGTLLPKLEAAGAMKSTGSRIETTSAMDKTSA